MEEAEPKIRKSRASSSKDAREYRQRGYDDALEFAKLIGMEKDYINDLKAKKDVIDPSGDTHSVKGGVKKWQIFLYGRGRFESDITFRVMNGIGEILIECIDAFPESFSEYKRDKATPKKRLRSAMVKLKDKLKDKTNLEAFLNKSIFNVGEVEYLTVKHEGIFHVFHRDDVLKMFCDNLEVCNSSAAGAGTTPEQKVLLRYKGVNLGEIEMRNDSKVHYREIRFNMIKPKAMDLLFEKIPKTGTYGKENKIFIYGKASKRFGRWKR